MIRRMMLVANIPGAPRSMRIVETGSDSVEVTWDAPASNGNLVQLYAVYYKPESQQGYGTVSSLSLLPKTTIKLSRVSNIDHY